MPYSRPTLTQIYASVLQDIQAGNLPGVDPLLPRAVLLTIAWAMAGLAYEHYQYQDWIAEQSVPWTATGENLIGWGALKGATPKPATTASFIATFSGQAGLNVPSGSALNTLNSLGYTSTADASVPPGGTSVSVPIQATGTGTAFNLSVGSKISLSTPISGINSAGTITSILSLAADAEIINTDFRTRMLQIYAAPPQGGDAEDYVEWALAVPGVTRAWCKGNGAGAGTVVVYTMFDLIEAAFGGFPQGTNGCAAAEPRAVAAVGDQLTVANALYSLQPVTALVYSVSPIAGPQAIMIANLYPNTAPILAGINAALTDLFLRIGTPLGMTIYPSDITEAIASVAGIGHFTLAFPVAPVAIPLGTLPTLGAVAATP